MAGWVFADLLLVLFLVGLGSAAPAEPHPQPKPEVVKPKSKPPIVGMKTDPVIISIRYDARAVSNGRVDGPLSRALCAKLRQATQPFKDERAALVLIFGGAPDVVQGQNSARAVATQLRCADATLFSTGTPTRPFWDGGLPLGTVRLEIFLFTTEATKRSPNNQG